MAECVFFRQICVLNRSLHASAGVLRKQQGTCCARGSQGVSSRACLHALSRSKSVPCLSFSPDQTHLTVTMKYTKGIHRQLFFLAIVSVAGQIGWHGGS